METQQQQTRGSRGYRSITFVVLAVTLALLPPLRQVEALVPIYGVDVPVWLVAIGFYTLGLAAGWASLRARRG